MVFDHVGNFQVFKSNQIVRCGERVCRLSGKIFALPVDLEIRFGQCLTSFLTILRLFLRARETAMQAFELFLRFAQEAGIGHRLPGGVSVELLESHIDAHLSARGEMFALALGLHAKLRIVAIRTLH
jgi:hypothetical protein